MPERACKAGALHGIEGTVGIVERRSLGWERPNVMLLRQRLKSRD
jgi:hypothetical protein